MYGNKTACWYYSLYILSLWHNLSVDKGQGHNKGQKVKKWSILQQIVVFSSHISTLLLVTCTDKHELH